MNDKPRLLTSAQLARELGLSPRTIARYGQEGLLTPALVTPGGQYRWKLDDVLAELETLRKRDQ